MCGRFGFEGKDGEPFADVLADKYYARELAAARAAGIIEGIGGNRFEPEAAISREDMMVILARAMDAAEKQLSATDLTVLGRFSDGSLVSEYAREAVSRLIKGGIIAGTDGRIDPKAYTTRAEVAVVLARIL